MYFEWVSLRLHQDLNNNYYTEYVLSSNPRIIAIVSQNGNGLRERTKKKPTWTHRRKKNNNTQVENVKTYIHTMCVRCCYARMKKKTQRLQTLWTHKARHSQQRKKPRMKKKAETNGKENTKGNTK